MLAATDGPRGLWLERALTRIADALGALALATLLGLLVFSILARDVLFIATPWLEEIATLTTVYGVAFASIGAWSRGVHIAIDVLVRAVPAGPRRWLSVVLQLASIAFLLIAAGGAVEMGDRSANNRTTALGLSFSLYYWGLVVAFAGMAVVAGLRTAVLALGPQPEPQSGARASA